MSEHLARIVKIDEIIDLPQANTLNLTFIYGFSVLVSKAVKAGDVGIFFEGGDLQLSYEYCKFNNLYRHSELNSDPSKKGYIQDTGRVVVEKMINIKSEGLFMPLKSLSYTGDYSKLKVGDTFDSWNDFPICCKYFNEKTKKNKQSPAKANTTPLFKKHIETEQLIYYIDSIKKGDRITIQSKWHGTSGRWSYTKVLHQSINLWNRIKKVLKFKYSINESPTWEIVTGSRNVVFKNNIDHDGFHGSESYRFNIANRLKPFLVKGQTVYGEIVGYVNDRPIMTPHNIVKLNSKKYLEKYGDEIVYSYGCDVGEYKLKIYRITYTTESGDSIDFTPEQLSQWCIKYGFLYAENLADFIFDGDKQSLMELVRKLAEREDSLCEDYTDPRHLHEGVIIRIDNGNTTPRFFKYKTFPFKVCEGIARESEVDIEDTL